MVARNIYYCLNLPFSEDKGNKQISQFEGPWNQLFNGYANTLRSHYKGLDREGKLQLLECLEALVQENKPKTD